MILRRFILLTLLLALPGIVRAQGSRKDDIVLNRFGQPVAGASITVCTSGATGTPCSPLAGIYSDVALTQPLSNPLTSDGQGNYHFYAAPGRYMIQISGAGVSATTIPDVILAADPTAPSFQSLSVAQNINALNLNLSGNLTVSGGVSSPSTLSAPQQGSAAPVQIGPHWYPGTATGLCSVPAAPSVATETVSSGSGNFSSGTTYYVKITLFNRNGQTTAGPATAYTPASGSTNRMLVEESDLSYRSGCYGFRVWVSSTGVNGAYYPAQAWTLPAAGISSWSRNAAGLVTVVTSASHGFIPGESITISGAAAGGGSTSINGSFTLVAQQGSSPTKLFFFQSASLGADSGGAGGTGTVIAGLGSDTYGHMAPGDFIVATVPASGSQPPAANTATIDPDQVALNAACNFSTGACSGGTLIMPQGSISGTTPLIVSNQQTITGVNTGNAGGKSERSCPWADVNLGCVMVLGIANGVRIQGLDIETTGNGIVVFGDGPGYAGANSYFLNNNIVTSVTSDLYAAVRYHGGVWYEQHWIGNVLTCDLACVAAESISGGNQEFVGGRMNAANLSASGLSTNGFLSVSSVTDPDRGADRGSFPYGWGSPVIFSKFYLEGGTGVQFDCIDVGCVLDNVETADSVTLSGTPANVRFGVDSNAGSTAGFYVEPKILNSHIIASASTSILLDGGTGMGPVSIDNSYLGCNTVCIDFNNLGYTVDAVNSSIAPYEGSASNKIINMSGASRLNVKDSPIGGSSDGGWAMHLFTGGIRFMADGQNPSPDLYFEPYNYNAGQYGGYWFAGSPGTASNLFLSYGVASRPNFTLYQNDGATALFNVNAYAGANQINLCNPSSPANSKINLGCPLVDSTGATVKGALTGTTASLGGSALSAGACASGSVSVTGATASMAVSVSPAADPGAGFSWMGFVSSSGTVTVRLCAIAAGTPASTTYNVRVIQ